MKGRATVFVDDYVLGRLPNVCAVTGVPTADQVKFRSNLGPLSPLWVLLVFLGQLGWLLLLAMAWSSGNELIGWLPYSHDKSRLVTRQRRVALVGGFGGLVALLLLGTIVNTPVLVGLAAAVAVGGVVMYFVVGRSEPRFELDASRRWVTMKGVHPNFVAAMERRQHDHDLSLPRL